MDIYDLIQDSPPISGRTSQYVGNAILENAKDLTHLNIEENKYLEYGVTPNIVNTQEELDKERASNQSKGQQFNRFVKQAVVNEIAIGTVLGASNLVDAAINAVSKEDNDYTNTVSKYLEDLKTKNSKAWEIYRENPNKAFDIGDFGWWAGNAVSVASTVSLMIPAAGATRLLSLVGKIGNVSSKTSRLLATAAKASKVTNPYKFTKAAEHFGNITTSAYFSRTMEGYLEARDVYKTVYDSSLEKLNNMDQKDKDKFFINNPEYMNLSNEEIAKDIAGEGADTTFKNGYALMLADMAQFKAIKNIYKGISNNTQKLILNKQLNSTLNKLNKNSNEVVDKLTLKDKVTDYLTPTWSKVGILGEGFEEAYQGVLTEKGKEVGEKKFNPLYDTKELGDYLTDPHIYEQAFWGVLGGIGFQGAAKGFKYIEDNFINKSKKEQQLADEKVKSAEISSWYDNSEKLISNIDNINKGFNPFEAKTDENGELVKDSEGNILLNDIQSEEDKRLLKDRVVNEFITRMSLNATDLGIFDMLDSYLSSEEINQYFDENLEDKDLYKNISQLSKKVNDYYTEEISKLTTNIDNFESDVVRLVANNITRSKLKVDTINEELNQLSEIINNIGLRDNLYNQDIENYKKSVIKNYYISKIKELTEEENKINNNKLLSVQAKEIYRKELNERKLVLNNFLAESSSFINDDSISMIYKDSRESKNYSKFITELNNYINGLTDVEINKTNLSKDLIDNINKIVNLEGQRSIIQQEDIPDNLSQLKEKYDTSFDTINQVVQNRLLDATTKINDWLEKQNDLEEAFGKLMNNSVEELRNELELLKLGHRNTSEYFGMIKAAYLKISENRNNNEVVIEDKEISKENAESIIEQTEELIEKSEDVIPDNIYIDEDGVQHRADVIDLVEDTIITQDMSELIEIIPTNEEIVLDDEREDVFKHIVKIYQRDRNYFDSLRINPTKEEFERFIDIIVDDVNNSNTLVSNDVREVAKFALRRFITQQAQLNKWGNEKFKEVLSKITFAQTKLISTEELNSAITEFLNYYITGKIIDKVNNKYIIDVETLLLNLINDENINISLAKSIVKNMKDYIINSNKNSNKNTTKFIFTNTNFLNQTIQDYNNYVSNLIAVRSKTSTIDNSFHISPSSKSNSNTVEAIPGKKVKAVTDKDSNSISFMTDDGEVGYITKVIPNEDNTAYTIKSTRGFIDTISIQLDDNGNKVYHSLFDDLYNGIIEDENDYIKLKELIIQIRDKKIAKSNINFTKEDIDTVLNNKEIKRLMKVGKISFTGLYATDINKTKSIINELINVLYYDYASKTKNDFKSSYYEWKVNKFANYEKTHKIQNSINTSINYTGTIGRITDSELLISEQEHSLKKAGLKHDRHPVVIVSNNGIREENSTTEIGNYGDLTVGTMGMKISNKGETPIIAFFTTANIVSETNKELSELIYKELTNLINSFQDGKISFETLNDSIASLIGGANSLFKGYSFYSGLYRNDKNLGFIDNNNNIILSVLGDGRIITRGNIPVEGAINAIVSQLKYNRSFYPIVGKDNTKGSSKHIKFDTNGAGFTLTIGEKSFHYENYGDFIITNEAFKTKQGYDSKNDTHYSRGDKPTSIYIYLDETISPEESLEIDIDDLYKEPNKSFTTNEFLKAHGVFEEKINLINEINKSLNNEFITDRVHYAGDKKGQAFYKNGKIYFTKRSKSSFKDRTKGTNNAIRLILHENIHRLINTKKDLNIDNITDELIETYDLFYDYITNLISNTTNKQILQELNNVRKLLDLLQTYKGESSKFAEEWLTEALSQPVLIKWLNSAEYGKTSLKLAENGQKSLWQKIIESIYKLLGLSLDNINKDSILAKQFSLLFNNVDNSSNLSDDVGASNITDESTDDNSDTNEQIIKEEQEYNFEDSGLDFSNKVSSDNNNESELDIDENYEYDEDGIDFAISDIIEENTNSETLINNMNDYLTIYPKEERAKIKKLLEDGDLIYICK